MKIPRFYQDEDISQVFEEGGELGLSVKNHRHAIQVLRLKVEEKLIVFDGRGGEYLAHIKAFDKRKSSVQLESFEKISCESPLSTTLNLAMIKPDKMDFAIQKAVELGINTIQPIYCERSVIKIKSNRLQKKMEHWQGIIIAACEQSGRTKIPEIHEPLTLTDCLKKDSSSKLSIVMLPTAETRLKTLNALEKDQTVALYIGPEGGFTDNEEYEMQENNIKGICFGPRILRAETAVIAGITAVQQRWGDC